MKLNIGIYNLQMQAMGGGERLTLVLAEHLSLTHNVWLFCAEPPDVHLFEKFFDVDLSRVKIVPLKRTDPLSRVTTKLRNNSPVALPHPHFRKLQELNLDLFVNNSFASDLKCPSRQGIFMCMFPHPFRSAKGGKTPIDSYSKVIAISRFTAEWVRKLWERDAEVIYPPCDDMGPPAPKENIILHVGRFIADSDADERHHKGQGVLLEAFNRLTSLHEHGWQLHFVGSVAPDKHSASLVKTVRQNAAGRPVFFHFDASREVVRDLSRKAKIFWLATGHGSTETNHPAKQEHFGIATSEAMSAGAVPVVYASGGQTEIVTDGVDGFLWRDVDGLLNRTLALANDSELRDRLSHEAIQTSKRFGRRSFTDKIDQLVESIFV